MLHGAQVDKLTGELTKIVVGRIEAGRLVVPSMPIVATRCLQLLRNPDFQTRKLVVQFELDPVLAALILREASTAAHGSSVKTLDGSIARLGAEKLKVVIMAYAAHELFESHDLRIKAANKRIWEHSIACALLARDLAAFAGNDDGDTCYLGGLLHDVGKPVFSSMMLEAERKLGQGRADWIDPASWTQAIGGIHRKIGTAVATQWNLPPEITAAIRDCSDYDSSERASVANIVRLANAVVKREGFNTEPIDTEDVDAMIMVGRSMLSIDESVIAPLANGLKTRVHQATAE